MEITEVRIKLMDIPSERLQAFCSITFDDSFVIRDLKIIEGASGPFVAMPSRKLTGHCPQCGSKNHLRAAYCNQCGGRLADDRAMRDEEGRAKLYADIAHPINSACREMIQDRVIREYRMEMDRSKLPGYVSRYEDIDEEVRAASHPPHSGLPAPHHRPAGAAPPGRRPVAQKPQPPAHASADGSQIDSALGERHPANSERHPRGPSGPPAPGTSATSSGALAGAKPPAASSSAAQSTANSCSEQRTAQPQSGGESGALSPPVGASAGAARSTPAPAPTRKEDVFGAGIL